MKDQVEIETLMQEIGARAKAAAAELAFASAEAKTAALMKAAEAIRGASARWSSNRPIRAAASASGRARRASQPRISDACTRRAVGVRWVAARRRSA